jgi:hypothetical protein
MGGDVKFVLLMIAHDGVKNGCWTKWFQNSAHIGMLCYVLHPDQRESIPQSTNVHLASPECLGMETEWGHPSVTFVYIKLLSEATKRFPNASHFCLVSGRCVPLVTPMVLVSWSQQNKNKSAFHKGEGEEFDVFESKVRFVKNTPWKEIPLPRQFKLLDAKKSLRSDPVETHAQWCIVSKKHAPMILHHNVEALLDLDKAYSDSQKYPKLRHRSLLAPDEYWILLILRLNHVPNNELIFGKVTNHVMPMHDSPNPILWTALDEVKKCHACSLWNPKYVVFTYLTLRQAILGTIMLARRQSEKATLFFFRKVEIEDPEFKPWDMGPALLDESSLKDMERLLSIEAGAETVRIPGRKRKRSMHRKSMKVYRTLSVLHPQALVKQIKRDRQSRERDRRKSLKEWNETQRRKKQAGE